MPRPRRGIMPRLTDGAPTYDTPDPRRRAPCVACSGSGISSKGLPCYPCRNVSPTQLKTYLGCQRKWWYQYIGGAPRVQTPGAELGDRVHKAIETYMRTGLLHDPAELSHLSPEWLAADIIAYLPERSSALRVEQELWSTRNWGYLAGRVDLVDTDARVVYDHKTSSNPSRYAIKAVDLPFDLQAMVYAAGALYTFNWDEVTLQWTYVPTKPKRGHAFPVRATVNRIHVEAQLALYDDAARALLDARSIDHVEATATNARECGNYGGCPYLTICSYPRRNPLAAALRSDDSNRSLPVLGVDTMSQNQAVLEKIRAQFAAQQAKKAQAADAPATAPQPPAPKPGTADAIKAQLAAKQAAARAAAEAEEAAMLAEIEAAEAAEAEAQAQATAKPAANGKTPLDRLRAAGGLAAAQAAEASTEGYTLFVGCIPLGQPYEMADTIVRMAGDAAAEANGVTHYREIEFGKSQAALAFQLRELVSGLTGNVVALGGRELDDAIHTLRQCAARIVQAV